MVALTRTIRFCLSADGTLRTEAGRYNSYAAWPTMRGLGRYYELHVTCLGEPDETTGYCMNITRMDKAVREHALPIIAAAAAQPDPPLGRVMRQMLDTVQPALAGTVSRLAVQLTPTFDLAMETAAMHTVLLSQRFSFSAAHRLHVGSLSDAENREIFGKCNNPAGHGHNYQLQVTVAATVDEAGRVMDVEDFEQIVRETIVDRFDHKHLNLDTTEFAQLNPSVENISIVIYRLLAPIFKGAGVRLDEVKVWETEKTVCTYRGQ